MKEDKIMEDRGIAVEVMDEEVDLDYYLDSDYGNQTYVQTKKKCYKIIIWHKCDFC